MDVYNRRGSFICSRLPTRVRIINFTLNIRRITLPENKKRTPFREFFFSTDFKIVLSTVESFDVEQSCKRRFVVEEIACPCSYGIFRHIRNSDLELQLCRNVIC